MMSDKRLIHPSHPSLKSIYSRHIAFRALSDQWQSRSGLAAARRIAEIGSAEGFDGGWVTRGGDAAFCFVFVRAAYLFGCATLGD